MSQSKEGIKKSNRVFDLIFSSLALITLSPIFILVGLGITLTSNGSIFYRQTRLGRNRKPFVMYKFRSMKTDAERNGPQLTVPNDPRVTSFGKFLRRFHIDEFPQFWNVIKGDMSIIGPRPERDLYARQIESSLSEFKKIFEVNPGITSLGMIKHGYASTISGMIERAKIDLYYLDKKSVKLDFLILAKTVATIFKGKGI